ncbi:hypothetical protein WG906_04880 [Pedobacter sp. P351]|uniref:hypothetical protein n=1 Tax=Pedobacter superstes TaxID=3133441 RepID=UPI0030965BA4
MLLVITCLSFERADDLLSVTNAGFEGVRDTVLAPPVNWKKNGMDSIVWGTDEDNKHSGKRSLIIRTPPNATSPQYCSFNQRLPIRVLKPTRFVVTAYIKTELQAGNIGLWAHARNKWDRKTGFEEVKVNKVRTGWTKYSLSIILDNETSDLYLGGYIDGRGTVWYDDFVIEQRDEIIAN